MCVSSSHFDTCPERMTSSVLHGPNEIEQEDAVQTLECKLWDFKGRRITRCVALTAPFSGNFAHRFWLQPKISWKKRDFGDDNARKREFGKVMSKENDHNDESQMKGQMKSQIKKKPNEKHDETIIRNDCRLATKRDWQNGSKLIITNRRQFNQQEPNWIWFKLLLLFCLRSWTKRVDGAPLAAWRSKPERDDHTVKSAGNIKSILRKMSLLQVEYLRRSVFGKYYSPTFEYSGDTGKELLKWFD